MSENTDKPIEKKSFTIKDAFTDDIKDFNTIKEGTRGDTQAKVFHSLIVNYKEKQTPASDFFETKNLELQAELLTLTEKYNELVIEHNALKETPSKDLEELTEAHTILLNEKIELDRMLFKLNTGIETDKTIEQIFSLELPVAKAMRKYRPFLTKDNKVSGNMETYPSELVNLSLRNYLNNRFDAEI